MSLVRDHLGRAVVVEKEKFDAMSQFVGIHAPTADWMTANVLSQRSTVEDIGALQAEAVPVNSTRTDKAGNRRGSKIGFEGRVKGNNKSRQKPTQQSTVSESDAQALNLVSKKTGPLPRQSDTELPVATSPLGDEPEAIHSIHSIRSVSDASRYPVGAAGRPLQPQPLQPQPYDVNSQFLFEPHSIYHTRNTSIGSAGDKPLDLNSPNGPYRNRTLPAYVTPLPPRISEDDIDYLANKGALTFPPDELRNSLLRSYIDFVHPFMPILSLSHIIALFEQGASENGTISLLLFQAIMFAGSAFADQNCLTKGGFESRKTARRIFFHRARLLYDFGCEQEEIPLIQTFLLLSYWFETPNEEKNTWHWLALATSLCQVSGFHHNSDNSYNGEHLKKRIWWSCFMRDRLVSLATRSPTRIKYEDCDVPMLTMEDFEILDTTWNMNCVHGCAFLTDINTQRDLAAMCIEKVKLCIPLGNILEAVDVSRDVKKGYDTPSTARSRMMSLAPDSIHETSVAEKEKYTLGKWAANLPDEVIYRRPRTDALNESITLHAALLQMLYFATTLYAAAKQSTGDYMSSHSSPTYYSFAEKARLAALEITRIAQDLQDLNLIRYLPTSGVTPVILAAVMHLRIIKSGSSSTRKPSEEAFHQCVKIMQKLRENYFSADFASFLMKRAIQNIDTSGVKSSTLNLKKDEPEDGRVSPGKLAQVGGNSHWTLNHPTDIRTSPDSLQLSLFQQDGQQPGLVPPTQMISPTISDSVLDASTTDMMPPEALKLYQDEMIFQDLMDMDNLGEILGHDGLLGSFM